MATTATGSTRVTAASSLVQSDGLLANRPTPVDITLNATFAAGTAADQMDKVYAKRLTFVASTAQDLDLTNLADLFGGTINFARVRSIVVKPKGTTNGATLTLSPHATNGWTNFLGTGSALKLGMATSSNEAGFVAVSPNTTGWAVSGTNKVLTLTPSAHAFDVDIEIKGCSA